jgi:hypothetical protein
MLEPNPSYQPHRHLEPFGEPRTMAVQWDLSSFESALDSAASTTSPTDKESDLEEGDRPSSQECESAWEKFPQPATIPAGWDLSELL